MITIILSAIIVLLGGGGGFLLIKKNRSLKRQLQLEEARITQYLDNKEDYEIKLEELKELRSQYDKLREQVLNSTGNDLSINLNGL